MTAAITISLVAGCSSSTHRTAAQSESSTPGGSAGSATTDPATGTPIKVGFINQGEGATTYPGTTAGAQAAFQYLNAHGGINGRPIDVEQCLDDGTPQVTAQCASTLVSKGVSVVLNGANLSDGGAHSILTGANIPMVGGFPYTPDDSASKTSFWMFPDPDLLAGGVKLMASTFNAKTIGYLMPDVASAQAPENVMASTAKGLNIDFKVARYSLTGTDFSTPIAQLMVARPQVMLTFTTDAGAAAAVQQFRSAGWTGPIVIGTSTAFLTDSNQAAAKDVYAMSDMYTWYSTDGVPSRDVNDIDTFTSAMKTYEASTPLGSYAQDGFATAMDLAEVLSSLPSNGIDSSSIMTALQANKDYNKFMGSTFNCGANTISAIPGNCSHGIQYVYWDGSNWKQTLNFVTANS